MVHSSLTAGHAGRTSSPTSSPRTFWARLAGACLLSVSLSAHAADLNDWWFYVKNDFWHQIEPLIQQGADPNRVSPDGQPTIVEAVRTQAWKTYDALASNPKVNVEAANKEGETALMLLSVLGETDRARKLLDRGAQVNRLGWTPLHYAASRGRLDVAKLLISRKAMINAPAPDGTTPLMMAALSKNDAMVTLLINAGADPTTRNLSNLNAADWARSANATRLATRLDELASRQEQQRGRAAASRPAADAVPAVNTAGQAPARADSVAPSPMPPSGQERGDSTERPSASDGNQPGVLRGVSGVRLGGE
ncbi:MAG: ankyrin repeat domain-containing protein [Alcaligenaceae bacterium]|nr:MAG: ankyrin repeat domain-containing protein [Alcaligenaceae bacterium]